MTEKTAAFALRIATLEDRPALEQLIAESARGLSRADYTDAQVEAALGGAFGVDSELIRDGTYFVAEAEGRIVGCGGWSRRATLFGSDAQPGRRSELLDPARDSARIRAFFVHPEWPGAGSAARYWRSAKRRRGRTASDPLSSSRRCRESGSIGRSDTRGQSGPSTRSATALRSTSFP